MNGWSYNIAITDTVETMYFNILYLQQENTNKRQLASRLEKSVLPTLGLAQLEHY